MGSPEPHRLGEDQPAMMRIGARALIERLVAGTAGVGAALVGGVAAAKKNNGEGSTGNAEGKDRAERTGEREERQSAGTGGGGTERDQRDRTDNSDDGTDGAGRERLRQRADGGGGGNADADADAGAVATDRDPVPTTTTTTTVADFAPARDSQASIEDPDGNVIVGFNEETQTLIARSGNVTASVGPDGPKVIIDDEAVVPITAPGAGDRPNRDPTPDPSGGDNDVDMVS